MSRPRDVAMSRCRGVEDVERRRHEKVFQSCWLSRRDLDGFELADAISGARAAQCAWKNWVDARKMAAVAWCA